jgi:hypothetical protein
MPGRGAMGTVLMLAAACRTAPQAAPVPLQGSASDLAPLAGTWEGRYRADPAGRRGTIAFRLRAGADTARGQVEMTFWPSQRLYGPERSAEDLPTPPPPCTTIDIAFVRIQASRIRGTIAPYWDPDCDCRVTTVFEGELVKDRIDGVFTTSRRGKAAPEITGRWFVTRQP